MLTTRHTARAIALAGATGLLSVAVMGAPASADTRQNGLVNLALTNTTVQVPVSVAANVCGVAVNVLASQLAQGPVDCDALGGSEATAERGPGSNTRQRGLVNISATDTVVQVPVGIAANVCGVAVNVLAQAGPQAPVTCTSEGVALADLG